MHPPSYIQGFEILERIGTGAESVIYRSREPSSRRIVALKHVVIDGQEDQKYLRHVRNEYNVLRGLQESANGMPPPQGIVQVYKLIRTGFLRRHKEHLLVMQYIEGRDLKHEGRYPTGQMVNILIGVCEALSALHRRGLIHGDMKPENIVVDHAGKPTLVDFGFSCKAGSHAESIKGTREYMAPEQVDRGRLTEKTDIYNFGASMYFLFAGRHVPAFIPAPGDGTLFIGSRSVDAPSLRTLNSSIPAPLDEIVLRCIRKDPLDRPSCIEEVREVLTEVSKGYTDG
jgi:eukaryotic-like serine/threonine-protein kinase